MFPFSLVFPAGLDAGTNEGTAGAGRAAPESPPMVPPETKPRSAGFTKEGAPLEGALLLGALKDAETKLLLNFCIIPVFNVFTVADLGAGTCGPDSAP